MRCGSPSCASGACSARASCRPARSGCCATTHGCAPNCVEERSRHKQRLEKLLEDALIKLSSVATDLLEVSARAMIEALIAGQRDPKVLADLACGKLNAKRAALLEALNGRFDDHHADLARLLLDQIDACSEKVDRLTARIEQLVAQPPDPPPTDRGPQLVSDIPVDIDPDAGHLTTVQRLDEIPGIAERATQIIIAEIGTDMTRFPTAAHLASYLDWPVMWTGQAELLMVG